MSVAFAVLLAAFLWYLLHQNDKIVVSNTSGNENGILVSAQGNSGVLSDKAYAPSLSNTFDVDKLSTAPNRNEVIAFTKSRPVAILTPANWTTGVDNVSVPFYDEIKISIDTWILAPDAASPKPTQLQRAVSRCAEIAALWASERMGVAFEPGGCDGNIHDARPNPFATFNCLGLEALVRQNVGLTPNRINIYVFNQVSSPSAGTGTGVADTCSKDFVALGSKAEPDVAIHELGHTFSLSHIDSQGPPAFNKENFMHSRSSKRQYFSEGQLFQAHVTPANLAALQPGSALNSVYPVRPNWPVRDCTKDPCPPLEKRIWADGALLPN